MNGWCDSVLYGDYCAVCVRTRMSSAPMVDPADWREWFNETADCEIEKLYQDEGGEGGIE